MHYDTNERFLLNYGWKHYWCDSNILKNFHLREVVKGPFAKPKFVNSVPYVTICQQDGSAIRLSEGVPDSWSEYLIYGLRLYQNYESMHKENVDIVPQLRKHYRLYIGQGIPSPWINDSEIYTTLENPRKPTSRFSVRKRCRNYSKTEHCNCCSRKYLFKCPDSCDSSSSILSKNHHRKNDCIKRCRCINRMSINHQRKKHPKESSVNSPKEFNFEADDEDENLNAENHPHSRRIKFPKEQLRECFCPYIKNVHFQKVPTQNKNHGVSNDTVKPQKNHSKLIQAKLLPFMISKSIQTDKPKVDRYTQCFWCNIASCNSQWGEFCKQGKPAGRCEVGCPTICPVTSFCCAQNPGFVCPYSFSNHFMTCKPHLENSNGLKKRSVKKKQLRESEDDLNFKFRLNPMQQHEASKRNFKWVNTEQEMVKPNYDVLENKNIYHSKNVDHMKYLTNVKLKYFLQREESFPKTQKFIQQPIGENFYRGNTALYYPSRVQLERFKSICNSTPEQFKPSYEEMKISPRKKMAEFIEPRTILRSEEI